MWNCIFRVSVGFGCKAESRRGSVQDCQIQLSSWVFPTLLSIALQKKYNCIYFSYLCSNHSITEVEYYKILFYKGGSARETWLCGQYFLTRFLVRNTFCFSSLFLLLLQGMDVGTRWCIKTAGPWHPRTILGHTQTTLFVRRKSKCLRENAWS